MRHSEFIETFKSFGFDIESSCENNFQNLTEEITRFNAGGITIFGFFDGYSTKELVVCFHKGRKQLDEKYILQSFLRSDCRRCWFKNDVDIAKELDANVLEAFKNARSGSFVIGVLTAHSAELEVYDSLEEGLSFIQENYDF